MSKTLFNLICDELINKLKASSVSLYGNIETKYIDDWFKDANDSNFSLYNWTLNTIIQCTPESVVKDIYANYVVQTVAKKLREYDFLHTVSVELEKKLLSYNDYETIFKAYYGNENALSNLAAKFAHELGIRLYTKINCLGFIEAFKGLKAGGTITFTIRPYDKNTRIYKASHISLCGLELYIIHPTDSVGFATFSAGPQNIEVGMITELAKYYGDLDDNSISYVGGGVNDLMIYVLK